MNLQCRLAAAALVLNSFFGVSPALALTWPLPPPGEDLIGELRWVAAGPEDTLIDLARAHGVGYRELVLANPEVDQWMPAPNSRVLLPTRFLLPAAPRKGIVINVAEMRMYYYPPAGPESSPRVLTYPISVGRDDWKTPLGETVVRARVRNPSWYPPQSIRTEHAERGDFLPAVVPPGPDNPLGPVALRLGWDSYLLHGTNKPFGIGMPVTHGCIRMYPEHIEELFALVKEGTPVRFVDQPYKIGTSNGVLHLEAHVPADAAQPPPAQLQALATNVALIEAVDWNQTAGYALRARGIPVPVAQRRHHPLPPGAAQQGPVRRAARPPGAATPMAAPVERPSQLAPPRPVPRRDGPGGHAFDDPLP